jgi:hypothetical protein
VTGLRSNKGIKEWHGEEYNRWMLRMRTMIGTEWLEYGEGLGRVTDTGEHLKE